MGVIVRAYSEAPWILWPDWQTWRFAQRCPEMVGFRDIHHIHVSLTGEGIHTGEQLRGQDSNLRHIG